MKRECSGLNPKPLGYRKSSGLKLLNNLPVSMAIIVLRGGYSELREEAGLAQAIVACKLMIASLITP